MHTSSATPLERVHVEAIGVNVSEVWLYDNIREVEEDGATYWEADSANGIVTGVPTTEEVTVDFDLYWEQFEQASMTDRELLEHIQAQVWFTAVMTDTEV